MRIGLKTNTREVLDKLAKRVVFSHAEIKALGLSSPTIARLLRDGEITKCSRGIYCRLTDENSDSSELAEVDYLTASKIFGSNCYIGGHTALSHYNLCLDIPQTIDVVTSPNVNTVRGKFRVIRTKLNLRYGVVRKGSYRIASIERAIIDAMCFSHLWESKGYPLALTINAIRRRLIRIEDLAGLSKVLGVEKIFKSFADLLHRELIEPLSTPLAVLHLD